MAKRRGRRFKVTGTLTVHFTKYMAVDEEDDPETYEPQLYADEIIGDHMVSISNEEVDVESVELVP